jgi:hypothetical protein
VQVAFRRSEAAYYHSMSLAVYSEATCNVVMRGSAAAGDELASLRD